MFGGYDRINIDNLPYFDDSSGRPDRFLNAVTDLNRRQHLGFKCGQGCGATRLEIRVHGGSGKDAGRPVGALGALALGT